MKITQVFFTEDFCTDAHASVREDFVRNVQLFNTKQTDKQLPNITLVVKLCQQPSDYHHLELAEDIIQQLNAISSVCCLAMDRTMKIFLQQSHTSVYHVTIHTAEFKQEEGICWTASEGWINTPFTGTTAKAAKQESSAVNKTWASEEPKYSRKGWIVSEHVRESFDDVLCMLKNQDLIYKDWHFEDVDPRPKCIVCFYGPPGTGKTMAAHILAKELGKKIICAKYSEIESKYMGETTKHLRSIFQSAQEQGAVLFFDECDNFLGKRVQNVSQSADQALNSSRGEMLILLEDFQGIVVFATNLISNIDHAFESRILKFMEVELPNHEARAEMIKAKLPPAAPLSKITDEIIEQLSNISEGFSGREIRNAILQGFVKAARDFSEKKSIGIEPVHLLSAFHDVADNMKTMKPESDEEIPDEAQEPLRKMAEQKIKESQHISE